MTDSDDTIARRYRELPREEPRAALDDAILAASRRAVARSSASRRWAAPVSIAAVLVLAFGITIEMERDEPGISAPPPPPAEAPLRKSQPAAPTPPEQQVDRNAAPSPATASPAIIPERKKAIAPPRETRRSAPAASEERSAPAPFPQSANRSDLAQPPDAASRSDSAPAASLAVPSASPAAPAATLAAPASPPVQPPAPAAMPQSAPARRMAPRMKSESADALQGAAPEARRDAESSIDRELERIAKLRAEGRDDEADKALEQFGRDHPGYRIPEAMWPRVRPR